MGSVNTIAALAAAVSMLVLASPVSAADLRVLSAGAVEPGLRPAVAAFEQASGHHVAIWFATPAEIRERLKNGGLADLVIAPPATLDELEAAARIDADRSRRVTIGRVGIGVAVPPGAARPDISSAEAFKRTIQDADALVFNRASTGLYLDGLFKRLDMDVQAKTTRYADGASVMEHVLRGTGRQIGLGAITEIMLVRDRGLQFVGPLPAALQNYTTYRAAATTAATDPAVVRELLAHLGSPASRATYAAARVDAAD